MFGMTLCTCEWDDLRAEDGRGAMHLAEVRERELPSELVEACAVPSEAAPTMKSMAQSV